MMAAMMLLLTDRLVHLAPVDFVIIVFYFALVLAIGFYLRGRANTGEDFFMAGREMTAWVAGLSFLSANLGALELMAGPDRLINMGILATHLVLDRRNPGDAVPGAGHDAVLLHLKKPTQSRVT